MPELIWKGKEKVINHHLEVPVQTLDRQYDFNCPDGGESGNKIIHGDNLAALKALLPQYEGKVKCIYIDPPYNTGNESWVYNDNVKDPRILKWLGEVVGKEGEDLCRHDKWLCMMYPRLQLLKRLLSEDGSIWISIDDNEVATLRLVLDEIFGHANFVANVLWQKRTSPDARLMLGDAHEHIIVYAKTAESLKFSKIPQSEKQLAAFKNPDNDLRGSWVSSDFSAQGFRPNQMYEITTPSGRKVIPPPGNCWKNVESVFCDLVANNRIWFGKDGNGVPRRKTFLSESSGVTAWSWWANNEVGHSQEAKQEVKSVLGVEDKVFDTPKPTRLIERIFQIATVNDSIILDSFAGSGTTAHAVLKLNQQDSGNRKFILIEMMDYAETITAERVKRVISGYGEESKAVAGTGGDFSYYSLGERVFDDEGNLNEALGVEKIREYVAWSERLPSAATGESPYWMGEKDQTGYYFIYEPAQTTVLNLDFLATLTRKTDSYLIYADTCLLDEEFMRRNMIRFKKIPRDISRF